MTYDWYRMDSSALVYPMVLTPNAQSLFRLGVKLTEKVDPRVLKQAVLKAFRRYPNFKCELKRGFFRPYLDENQLPFIVEEDDGLLLKILDFKHNNRYLLRVTYYGTRIFIDFFHGLCDGSGGMEFLKTVVYYYALLSDIPLSSDNIRTLKKGQSEEEKEDAFKKYYVKPVFSKGVSAMAKGKAFRIRDDYFESGGFGLIQATVGTDKLLVASRAEDCSVTVLLASIMLQSIAENYISGSYKGNLTVFIPINLRKRYQSDTTSNFTVFAKVIIPKNVPITVKSMVPLVKKALSEQLDKDEIDLKMGFSSLFTTMPLLRYAPFFVKSLVSKISRNLAPSKQTFILSNLGKIELGKNRLIDGFLFNLNCNKKTPLNVAIVSYGNKTVISFTRKIVPTNVERSFCRILASYVGKVEVISNFREECDAL